MYRQLTAILLILAFAAQNFNRAFILLDYYANTASFIKVCENKAQPTIQCHGKCQVMKKLKEEQKNDEENPERKLENKNELTLSAKSFTLPVQSLLYSELKSKIHSPVSNSKSVDRSLDFFHPPQVS